MSLADLFNPRELELLAGAVVAAAEKHLGELKDTLAGPLSLMEGDLRGLADKLKLAADLRSLAQRLEGAKPQPQPAVSTEQVVADIQSVVAAKRDELAEAASESVAESASVEEAPTIALPAVAVPADSFPDPSAAPSPESEQ